MGRRYTRIAPVREAICPVCGELFKTRHRREKYCSKACCDKVMHYRKPQVEITCLGCGMPVKTSVPNKKYCSEVCRRKTVYPAKQHGDLPTGTCGAINEYRVAVDLLKRGYQVFRAMSPSCSCDLAVLHNKRLLRVEVTTGYRVNGRLTHPKAGKNDWRGSADILAVALPDGLHYEGLPLTK